MKGKKKHEKYPELFRELKKDCGIERQLLYFYLLEHSQRALEKKLGKLVIQTKMETIKKCEHYLHL